MKERQAFTIIELLISMSLASVIILGLMQAYTTGIAYLEGCRERMDTHRKICLLFNQLERDLTTAFIPWVLEEIEKPNVGAADDKAVPNQKKTPTPEETKKIQDAKSKKLKSYFVATAQGDLLKFEGKKVQLLKDLAFISTGPLHIYNEKRARIVRIKYQLVVDKNRKNDDKICYKLMRKETADIDDVKMAEDDPTRQDGKKMVPVRTHVVADGVKSVYLEFFALKESDSKKDGKPKTEEVASFVWGDEQPRCGVVPQRVAIKVELWNQAMTDSVLFETMVPIFSYSYPTESNEAPGRNAPAQAAQSSSASSAAPSQTAGPDLQLQMTAGGVSS